MLPDVTASPLASRPESRGREFADRGGAGWRVWWSATAQISTHACGFAVRPPGIWFEQLATGGRRYLFHPGLDASELAKVPEPWLIEWLTRADPLPVAAPTCRSGVIAPVSAQVTTR